MAHWAISSLARPFLTLRLLPLAECPDPAWLFSLHAARDRQRVGADIVGDHRSRRGDGAMADLHRRHQGGIGADKGARADLGVRLGEAVIVAGDGARADIGAFPDRGVT